MATAPNSRAVVHRSKIGRISHVRISGTIDETFSPEAVGADFSGHVILDLGRLERISSFGVRQWMVLTRALPPGAVDLYVINAPPVVVDQLSMVEGFAGVARILSVFAPYICDACEEDRMRLIDLRTDAAIVASDEAPARACGVCGTKLRFNDEPAQYFAHARLQPLEGVAPAVDRYLASLRPAQLDLPTTHLKMVEDDISFIRLAGKVRRDLSIRRLAGGLQGRVAFDFAYVTGVEEGGAEQLAAMLAAASADAVVFLWRVPLFVLEALCKVTLDPKLALASLWLPFECRNCGQKLPQRVPALAREDTGGNVLLQRPCSVCGGPARAPSLKGVQSLLSELGVEQAPFKELEQLEPRALSQSLETDFGGKSDAASGKTSPPVGREADAPKLQILKRIGQGGMAEVFLARQLGLQGFEKYVVLKKVLPQFAGSQHFIDMLFAEARSSARLTHPNIVQIYDVGELHGSAYITMEHVRGPDLRRVMVLLSKANLSLPIEHGLRIVSEIAAGLHHAHSYVDPTGTPHPVIHRDVSPHNILISLDGAIKLSDFGIAKAIGESENTQPGMIKGKVAYIAPEAVKGEPVDGRADVFSLGVVLYELLTGKTPFRRESDVATLQAIVMTPAPNPRLVNPLLKSGIADVVMKALEKLPENRYQSAGQFRLEIEEAMTNYELRSAPDVVAKYVTENLSEAALEYKITVPVALATPTTSATHRELNLTAAPTAPPPEPREDSSNERTSLVLETVLAPEDKTQLSAHTPAAAPANPVKAPPRKALVPWTTAASQKLAAFAEAEAASQATPTPAPAASTPPPSDPASRPRRSGPSPSEGPQAVRLATPNEPEPHPSAVTQEKKKRRWRGAAGLGALAGLALVIALALIVATTGKVQVVNLAAGERLYLDGLRVETTLLPPSEAGAYVLGIAKDGALWRFGTVAPSRTIEADSIPRAKTDPAARANVHVASDPRGCAVTVDGAQAPTQTPVAIEIQAGRELLVEINCAGLPRRTQWVLAASGQQLQVSAQMFPSR